MGTSSLLSSSLPKLLMETLTPIVTSHTCSRKLCSLSLRPPPRRRASLFKPNLLTTSAGRNQSTVVSSGDSSLSSSVNTIPLAGADDALMGFISGKRRATEVAHSVWKNIINKGDTVIDATCGNGNDTLALLKMIADESGRGSVYAMDIQKTALQNTSYLLEGSIDKSEMKLVKLFLLCHSKMEDIVPKNTPVRLIAFNLGYLPGGDKTIITTSSTTLMALQCASRILESGGLISVVVYVGHPGGRDELETVQSFASSLPMESWFSSKFEMLNRPDGPVLIFLFKK